MRSMMLANLPALVAYQDKGTHAPNTYIVGCSPACYAGASNQGQARHGRQHCLYKQCLGFCIIKGFHHSVAAGKNLAYRAGFYPGIHRLYPNGRVYARKVCSQRIDLWHAYLVQEKKLTVQVFSAHRVKIHDNQAANACASQCVGAV